MNVCTTLSLLSAFAKKGKDKQKLAADFHAFINHMIKKYFLDFYITI